MDQLHTANKVCGGCCAISLNTVDTESSVSPIVGERSLTADFHRLSLKTVGLQTSGKRQSENTCKNALKRFCVNQLI